MLPIVLFRKPRRLFFTLLLDFSAEMTLPDRSSDVCGYEADAGQEDVCKKKSCANHEAGTGLSRKGQGKTLISIRSSQWSGFTRSPVLCLGKNARNRS